MNNFFEGVDDNKATATLINNAFLVMQFDALTGGTNALINFSEELLVKEIPLLLPKETIVVEILERVEISEKVIQICKNLKNSGYRLALDDFVFSDEYLPLLDIADMVKIEFRAIPFEQQNKLINRYRNKMKFLAEKIETREDYQLALSMGYDYFQGYFFSKPVIMKGKELEGINANLIRIIDELNQEEPDYQRITEIIETDIGLSYKLLKMANSLFFGSVYKIYSIKQALVRLGLGEIKKWVYLMMLKDIQSVENKELVKNCLVRGKFMELLGLEVELKHKHLEIFLTGLFSSINILLGRDMTEILEELPLSADVKDALLGKNNNLRQLLNFVINFEKINIGDFEASENSFGINQNKLMGKYIEALKWVMKLEY